MDGGDDLRMRQVAGPRHVEHDLVANAGRPLRQHQDAIRQLRRFLDVVRDEDDRSRLLAKNAGELAPHLQARQVVERRERLVHQEQRRVAT